MMNTATTYRSIDWAAVPEVAPLKTRLVATLGPATDGPEVVERMASAELSVARINSAHNLSPDVLRARIDRVRAASARFGRHVAVLLDLQGPKLRVGALSTPVVLTDDESVMLTTTHMDADGIPVEYAPLAREVRPGQHILLDDGNLVSIDERASS